MKSIKPQDLHGLIANHPYYEGLTRYVFLGFMDQERELYPIYNVDGGYTVGLTALLNSNPHLKKSYN